MCFSILHFRRDHLNMVRRCSKNSLSLISLGNLLPSSRMAGRVSFFIVAYSRPNRGAFFLRGENPRRWRSIESALKSRLRRFVLAFPTLNQRINRGLERESFRISMIPLTAAESFRN